MTEPYLAAEDSALLRTALKRYSGRRCLEMGSGNGGNLMQLAKTFVLTVGTDLTRPSTTDWLGSASTIMADSASCFRDESFDLVAFNPPYLGSEEVRDIAVDAGPGHEVLLRFLREALRVARKDGKVVFLASEETPPTILEKECGIAGFRLCEIASERGFFERLVVYEASPRSR